MILIIIIKTNHSKPKYSLHNVYCKSKINIGSKLYCAKDYLKHHALSIFLIRSFRLASRQTI